VHVEVHITKVEQCETVERRWKSGDPDFIVPQFDSERVASPAATKAQDLQGHSDHRMGGVPILDVEEASTLPEDPRLGGIFDPKALTQVKATDPGSQSIVFQSRSGGVAHA
jgi:hypothetical protein